MGEGDQVSEEYDGLHPLDRDYTVQEKNRPRRARFSKVPAINLGVLCFLLGGVSLLIGVVLSQGNPMSQASTGRIAVAHRIGMWFVLSGGVCVFLGVRAHSELYVQRRKWGKKSQNVQRFVIQANDEAEPLTLNAWRMAMNEFGFLIPGAMSADVLRPEIGDVHMVIDHVVVAVLRWEHEPVGAIHLVMRKKDRGRVLQCAQRLVEFLDAKLVRAVGVDAGNRD